MASSQYDHFSKEQLLALLQNADAKKHYGLVWEEDKVPEKVVTDCLEKNPILKEVKKKNIEMDGNLPKNILIEGDSGAFSVASVCLIQLISSILSNLGIKLCAKFDRFLLLDIIFCKFFPQ